MTYLLMISVCQRRLFFLCARQVLTVTVEQSEHHVAHVIRQLHFGHGAGHLLHGN